LDRFQDLWVAFFTPFRSILRPILYRHNVSVVDRWAVPPWSSNSSSSLNPDEHAVVSSLYTDSYLTAITTLGHSLKAANMKARMILIYIPGRLSPRTLCLASAAGWTLHPVSLVNPPHDGKGIDAQYTDQYTKLRIWTLDSLGIKSLVYLDADTLVRRNFDELFTLPFNFAAVPDIFTDRGFTMSFNAGVMYLRPNTTVFEDMLEKIETAVFPPVMAEQAFLNVYFGSQVVRLPFAYNGNLAIKRRSPMLWEKMVDDMRIVHYTLEKPFPKHGLGYRETLKQFFEGRMTMQNGIWKTEMGWWQESWREMALEMQIHSQCSEYNNIAAPKAQ
jgi:Glycosyl transferase family 8